MVEHLNPRKIGLSVKGSPLFSKLFLKKGRSLVLKAPRKVAKDGMVDAQLFTRIYGM